jgi:LysM repeat protein
MTRKVSIILLAVFTLSLALSACTLPASTPPPSTPTVGEFPFPVEGTPNPTSVAETQVAKDAAGGGQKEANPQPTAVKVTPEPAESQPQQSSAAIPTLTRPQTYTLQKGEWPFCIARRYNLDAASLLALNGLTINDKPVTGTVLKIPTSGTWSNGPIYLLAHPATYTVRSGDTINTVACKYGDVSPEAIIAANNLQSPYTLTAGQVLAIP